jgi:hypothetical protein
MYIALCVLLLVSGSGQSAPKYPETPKGPNGPSRELTV